MRNLTRSLIAAVVTLALVAPGQSAERPDKWWETSKLPLYGAFIAFCVETNAELDAVKAAVEAAGGKQSRPRWTDENGPLDSTVTIESWDITVSKNSLSVTAGFWLSHHPRVPSTMNCSINSWDKDGESVDALKRWAGVPGGPLTENGETLVYSYYLDQSGRHVPLTEERHDDDDLWMLTILTYGPSVSLMHFLPRDVAPSP
jgi:hypothetical protein